MPWDVRGTRQGQGQHTGIPPSPFLVRCPVPSIPVPQSLPQLPRRLSLAPAAGGRAPCCQGDPSSPPPWQAPGWGVLGTALGPAPLSACGQSQVGAGLLGPLGGFVEGSSSAQAWHRDGTRRLSAIYQQHPGASSSHAGVPCLDNCGGQLPAGAWRSWGRRPGSSGVMPRYPECLVTFLGFYFYAVLASCLHALPWALGEERQQ